MLSFYRLYSDHVSPPPNPNSFSAFAHLPKPTFFLPISLKSCEKIIIKQNKRKLKSKKGKKKQTKQNKHTHRRKKESKYKGRIQT